MNEPMWPNDLQNQICSIQSAESDGGLLLARRCFGDGLQVDMSFGVW